ncbi:unnamed protein product, partial [Lymnaea stagnalis]
HSVSQHFCVKRIVSYRTEMAIAIKCLSFVALLAGAVVLSNGAALARRERGATQEPDDNAWSQVPNEWWEEVVKQAAQESDSGTNAWHRVTDPEVWADEDDLEKRNEEPENYEYYEEGDSEDTTDEPEYYEYYEYYEEGDSEDTTDEPEYYEEGDVEKRDDEPENYEYYEYYEDGDSEDTTDEPEYYEEGDVEKRDDEPEYYEYYEEGDSEDTNDEPEYYEEGDVEK